MADFIERDAAGPVDFPFPEKMARQKAGLSEEDMRVLRNKRLKLDVDFKYHKKAIFWNAGALKKSGLPLEPAPETKPAPSPAQAQDAPIAAEVQKLLVVRANLPNKRMLLACAADENPDRPKKTVRVRVKSQEGFRARALIEARLAAGYSDLFDLVSKYPRKKPQL